MIKKIWWVALIASLAILVVACQSTPETPTDINNSPPTEEIQLPSSAEQEDSTTYPDTADGYFEKGIAHLEAREFEEAALSFDSAIEKKPDFIDAYYQRGMVHGNLRNYNEAIADLERYLELNPTAPDKDDVLGFIETLQSLAIAIGPVALTTDGNFLWVANSIANTVMQINSTDGSIVATFPINEQPVALLIANNALWVVAGGSDEVIQLNLADGSEMGRFTVGKQPIAIAADEQHLWIVNFGDNNLSKLQLSDGRLVATIETGANPRALLIDGDSIWVANQGEDTIWHINKTDETVIGKYPVISEGFKGAGPRALAYAQDSIWVTTAYGLSKIKADNGELLGTYETGAGPIPLIVHDNNLWILNDADGTITKFTLPDGTTLKTYPVNTVVAPSSPIAMTIQGDFLWVADARNDALIKVNTANGAVDDIHYLGERAFPADALERLPSLAIADGLFRQEKGSENFNQMSRPIYANNYWLLTVNATESILPIPHGWTTVEDGKDTYILFGNEDDIDNPEIRIRVSVNGYIEDFMNSEDALAEYEADLAERDGITILKREILDNDKSYIVLSTETEEGEMRYLIQAFSRNSARQWFYTFSVFTAQDKWPDYYPLIQAMLARWAALDNTPIGINLPDNVID